MLSVTLVHPAKTVGRNEMSFDMNTSVVPRNAALDRGPGHPGKKNNEKLLQRDLMAIQSTSLSPAAETESKQGVLIVGAVELRAGVRLQ